MASLPSRPAFAPPGAWLHVVRLGRPAPKAGQVHTAWTAAGAVSLPLAALRGARCRRRAAATKTVAEQWFQEQLSLPATSLATRGVALLKDLDAPQRKQEAFRYTDLESLLYSLPKTGKEVEPELTDLEDSEAYRLVFVDGKLSPGHCRLPDAEAQALLSGFDECGEKSHFEGLLEQLPEIDLFRANSRDALGCAKLAALNQASFRDAACVLLPEADEMPELTLELVFVSTGPSSAPRAVLDVGKNRRLKVVETHLSADASDEALSNGLCRVLVAENAQVQHEVLQQKAGSSSFAHSITAEVAAEGHYGFRAVQCGARCARLNVAVALQGEKSSCELNAVMLADDKQQLDLHSLIHHSVPSCRSKQAHKNLVGGSAECIFKGTIRVDAEAQQTESSQMVRSLLLSKKSQVKAMPSLQIQADDVSCSHGAALTQLDPDELFYLASRGLDNADARRLMLTGFPTDLLEGLKELAPKAYSRVMSKLVTMAESNE